MGDHRGHARRSTQKAAAWSRSVACAAISAPSAPVATALDKHRSSTVGTVGGLRGGGDEIATEAQSDGSRLCNEGFFGGIPSPFPEQLRQIFAMSWWSGRWWRWSCGAIVEKAIVLGTMRRR